MTLMMQSFFNRRPVVTTTFAALGGIWAAYKLKSLLDFSYLHFLHRSSLDRYKASKSHDPTTEAWALVTGASDGIGRGFSEELLARGFNVILHGRNEKKLNDVKSELSKQWPDRQIRIFVFDATGDIRELELAVQQLAGLNIQVLINNIGAGQRPFWVPLAENTAKRIGLSVDVDARFPTEITRILLPELVKNSPSLIINIGSLASESPVPYASVLSGTKAYNKAWSRSLGLEMMAEGHEIEVLHILVGMVATVSLEVLSVSA